MGEKARLLAAHLLEVDPEDLAPFDEGRIAVRGAPAALRHVGGARGGRGRPERLPEGMEPGLASAGMFREPGSTFPFGTARRRRGGGHARPAR